MTALLRLFGKVWIFVMLVLTPSLASGDSDSWKAVQFGKVQLGGELQRRREICENYVFRYQNRVRDSEKSFVDFDDDILDPFIHRLTPAEGKERILCMYAGIGKTLDAASAFGITESDPAILGKTEDTVEKLIASQDDDGYIGFLEPQPDDEQLFSHWTAHDASYIAVALLHRHQWTGDTRSLDAARRLLDYMIERWPKAPTKPGACSPVGIIEACLIMTDITGDSRYREFAASTPFDGRFINMQSLRDWNQEVYSAREQADDTPTAKFETKCHVYRWFSRAKQQLSLHQSEPNEELLRMPRYIHASLMTSDKSGMLVTGATGISEGWDDTQRGTGAVGEVCASVYLTWMLSKMIEVDGDLRFGDIMERVLLNHVFAAQNPDASDGRVRYFVPISGSRNYRKGAHCCEGNFKRLLSQIGGQVFYAFPNGFAVNLYTPSETVLRVRDSQVHVRQDTRYPRDGAVHIEVDSDQPERFCLRLRIPRWCSEPSVTVNGGAVSLRKVPGGVEIDRTWEEGDIVHLQLPMSFRWIKGRGMQSGRFALMSGPRVFCLSRELNPDLKEVVLRDLVLDPDSVTVMEVCAAAFRGGESVQVNAWLPGKDPSQDSPIPVILSDFPEPTGEETYFHLSSDEAGCDDELIEETEPESFLSR